MNLHLKRRLWFVVAFLACDGGNLTHALEPPVTPVQSTFDITPVREWRQQHPTHEMRFESLEKVVSSIREMAKGGDVDHTELIEGLLFVTMACHQLGWHEPEDPTLKVSNMSREFGLLARSLGVKQVASPPTPADAGLPSVMDFIKENEAHWEEMFPFELIQRRKRDGDKSRPLEPSLIADPELRAGAEEVMRLHGYGQHWAMVWRSYHSIHAGLTGNMEQILSALSSTRGIPRQDFYQTRLAMLELVVEHCPDEELVKRLFPTGVVPPPPVMGDFQGRDEIEDREAELMERLKVDSARRQEQRAGRLEQMIEVWDQARREAEAEGAGDREQGR